jgi:hypothetical protein
VRASLGTRLALWGAGFTVFLETMHVLSGVITVAILGAAAALAFLSYVVARRSGNGRESSPRLAA